MFGDKKTSIVTSVRFVAIIPAVVTIACLVPFLNKAFHIDDPLFLWTAKQIQTSPVDFYGFSVNWYGWDMPMAEVTQNPPGACYYIAMVTSLFGWSEVTLHIAFLIPAVSAALGTYYLAKRFCARPVLAALAGVLTPAFLVSSTNIMCDTMMLAFWVWAVFLWVRGMEAKGYPSLFFAAVLVAFCALTKYFGMALLPLLFVYSLMHERKLGYWLLFLLIPTGILADYQWVTHNLYGYGLLSDAAAYATNYSWTQGSTLFSKGLTGLVFTGGCVLTVFFYGPLLWSKRVLIAGVAVTILFVLILSFIKEVDGTSLRDTTGARWGYLVQIGLMAGGGAGIFALVVSDFWKNRNAESLLLLLWVLGTFIFAAFINWTINARSILPMVPAAGILLMRRIDRRSVGIAREIRTWRVAWPLAPAVAVSLLVCWADYTLANTARTAAAYIHEDFRYGNQTVWFQGHWGFQYYMEQAGFKAADLKNPKYLSGDIIILPVNNTNIKALPKEMVFPSKSFKFDVCHNITTMDMQLGAGFYSNIWGMLPFVFGPVGPEAYFSFVAE
jgi:4-amino-4-deoxy-L-arabinose transferase-like glycosyltransferase